MIELIYNTNERGNVAEGNRVAINIAQPLLRSVFPYNAEGLNKYRDMLNYRMNDRSCGDRKFRETVRNIYIDSKLGDVVLVCYNDKCVDTDHIYCHGKVLIDYINNMGNVE